MTENLPSTNPPFFDLVGQVRAIRLLKPGPVPLETIRKVLEAGVQVPSGMNTQPWAFLAIHGKERRAWFGERYEAAIKSRFGDLSVPDGVFENELHERFGIPGEFGVAVAIPIGYPLGSFGPITRRPAAEITYFDSWGNTDPGGWR